MAYTAAFVAMLGAAVVLAVGTLGSSQSIPMMYVSSALSVIAIVGASAAVLLARR
jgi:hypothetical protein